MPLVWYFPLNLIFKLPLFISQRLRLDLFISIQKPNNVLLNKKFNFDATSTASWMWFSRILFTFLKLSPYLSIMFHSARSSNLIELHCLYPGSLVRLPLASLQQFNELKPRWVHRSKLVLTNLNEEGAAKRAHKTSTEPKYEAGIFLLCHPNSLGVRISSIPTKP